MITADYPSSEGKNLLKPTPKLEEIQTIICGGSAAILRHASALLVPSAEKVMM